MILGGEKKKKEPLDQYDPSRPLWRWMTIKGKEDLLCEHLGLFSWVLTSQSLFPLFVHGFPQVSPYLVTLVFLSIYFHSLPQSLLITTEPPSKIQENNPIECTSKHISKSTFRDVV